MTEKNYDSREDFLANFDQDFDAEMANNEVVADEATESNETTDSTETPLNEVVENTEPSNDENNVTEENNPKETSTIRNMRGQLRETAKVLQAERQAHAQKQAWLTQIANNSGYTNVEEWMGAVNASLAEKQAKEKGIPVEVFEQLTKQEQMIQNLAYENQTRQLEEKSRKLIGSIEDTISKYSLSDTDREDMFNKLEERGYTLETLMSLPDPSLVLNGVLSDRVAKSAVQQEVAKANKFDELDTGKITGKGSTPSLEDEVDDDLDAYYASRGRKYK